MWNRIRRWFALGAAVFAVVMFGAENAGARGGGGGGRGGGRGGSSRGGRGSSVRGALRGAGRGAGRAQGGNTKGKSAKEWELLRDQEARLEMIKERRARLMDLDRKKEQEAWLGAQRVQAADEQSRTGDVR